MPDITETVKLLNHGVQNPGTVGIAAHSVSLTAAMSSETNLIFWPLHPFPKNTHQFPLDTMMRGSHIRYKYANKGITLRYFKCCGVETWSGTSRDRIIGGTILILSEVISLFQKKGIQSEEISILYGGPSEVLTSPPRPEGQGGP